MASNIVDEIAYGQLRNGVRTRHAVHAIYSWEELTMGLTAMPDAKPQRSFVSRKRLVCLAKSKSFARGGGW